MRLGAIAAVALLLVSVATAKKPPPPQEMERVELARTHFAAAEQLFTEARYREAVVEYEMAQISFASQSVDLQIARCYDRLGQPQPAVQAYQRYLAANADARDAVEAKERILALRDRPATTPPPASLPPPPLATAAPVRQFTAPIALGGFGLALLTAGAALEGAASADFDRLRITCAPHCAAADVDPLRTRYWTGIALMAISGGVAFTVVLWVVASRSPRPRALLRTPLSPLRVLR